MFWSRAWPSVGPPATGTDLRSIAAHLGLAYALQGRLAEGRALLEEAISETTGTGGLGTLSLLVAWLSAVCQLAGRRNEAWQHTRQALDLAQQHKERANEALGCTSLASFMPTPIPLTSYKLKSTTSKLWPWPRDSACARSWPIAISGLARCIRRSADASRLTPSCPCYRAVPLYGHDLLATAGGDRLGGSGQVRVDRDKEAYHN